MVSAPRIKTLLVAGSVLLAGLSAGCASSENSGNSAGYGSITARAVWPGDPGHPSAMSSGGFQTMVAPAGVESIVATVTGPGMSPVSRTFNATPGAAGSGAITSVPSGTGRIVTISGYSGNNGSGTKTYEGEAYDVTVTSGNESDAGAVNMFSYAPGTLDLSFGDSNEGFTLPTTEQSAANAVAIDSQGRIVVVGYLYLSALRQMAVWRFNADGTLDPSFNAGSVLTDDGEGDPAIGNAVLIDSEDRILVAGQSASLMTVWRITESGGLDTTFAPSNGYRTSDGGGSPAVGYGIIEDSSGRIVVAGTDNAGSTRAAVWRMSNAGVLDTTFFPGPAAYGGWQAPVTARVTSLFEDSNGSIVVAGYDEGASPQTAVIWRVETSGTAAFEGVGTAQCYDGVALYRCYEDHGAGSTVARIRAISYDSAGNNIYGVGVSQPGANNDMTIWRLNNDTPITPDSSFSTDGHLPQTDTTFNFGEGWATAFDSSGRMLVAGRKQDPTRYLAAVWRYTTGFALDTTFNAGGEEPGIFVQEATGGGAYERDRAHGIAVTSRGKIVVVGQTADDTDSIPAMAVWQINP